MDLTIRPARAEDGEAVAALMDDVYAAFEEKTPSFEARRDFFERELRRPERQLGRPEGLVVLLAFSGDRPVGLLTLAFAPTTKALGTFAWLDDFHVQAAERRRGVGAALLEAAIAHASRAGAHEIRLAAERSPDLARLYERAGFRRAGTSVYSRSLSGVSR